VFIVDEVFFLMCGVLLRLRSPREWKRRLGNKKRIEWVLGIKSLDRQRWGMDSED
jgi:hypothetical protein